MEPSHDNLSQVSLGKRCWQDGTPITGQLFEYTVDDIDNRKTVGRGGALE